MSTIILHPPPFPKIMDGLNNREAPWWGEISVSWEDTNKCVSWNKFDVAGLCETSIILSHCRAPRSSSPPPPLAPGMESLTVELHLSGLIRTAIHPDMQKARITGFFFENRLHWQFAVRLLLFAVCTGVWTFLQRLLKPYKPQYCTALDLITGNFKANQFCRILDKFTGRTEPIRRTGVLL